MKACGHSCCFSFIYLQTCEGVQVEKCPNYQQCLFYMLPEMQMHWTLTKEYRSVAKIKSRSRF